MSSSAPSSSFVDRPRLSVVVTRALRLAERIAGGVETCCAGLAVSRGGERVWVSADHVVPAADVPVDVETSWRLPPTSPLRQVGCGADHALSVPYGDDRALVVITPAPIAPSDVPGVRDAAAILDETGAPHGADADASLRYHSVIEAMSEGVVVQNADGSIAEVNTSAQRILGLSADELAGRTSKDPAWHAIHPDGTPFPGEEHPAMVTLQTGEPQTNVPMGLQREDGCTWLHINTEPLRDPITGELHGVVATFTDVTETHRRQATLRQSEAQLRAFLENVPVGVYRSTPDGKILFANDTLVEMMGYPSLAVLKGIDLEGNQFPGNDREAFKQAMADDGFVAQRETQWRKQDGTPIDVVESARIVYDEAGAVSHYEGVVEDVTEQKEAARALQAEKEFVDTALDSLPGVFYMIDEDLTLHRWNETLETVTGHDAETISTLPVQEFLHPEDRETALAAIHESFATGQGRAEVRLLKKGGRLDAAVPHLLTATLIHVRGQTYLVGTGVDISERIQAETAMREAKEEAEEMNRLKSAFLANMSHEIRTPLTSIIGFAEVLSSNADGEQRELLNLIRRSGHRLKDTLTSVLDLARLESESVQFNVRRVDLVEQVQDTVALMRPQIGAKPVQLTVDVPDAPVFVHADPNALDRVAINLLSNAIKFTSEGRVSVTVETDATHVFLSVVDTGVGIDAAFLDVIFEEFRQESDGVRRSHEGSGLGLTITRHLVTLMNGTINVESTKGHGSTFTVTLPLA